MSNKLIAVFCVALLIICSMPTYVLAATGSVTFTAKTNSVNVGQEVTLTFTYKSTSVGSGKASITYDSELFTLKEISGGGIYNANAAGIVQYTFSDTSKKSSLSFDCVFVAKKAGSCSFRLDSSDLTTFDEEPFSVPSQTVTVSCKDPAQSGNADLAYLRPSAGTLVPAFAPNVTEYTITVPYTVTSLLLTTDSKDQNAQVAVNGSSTMKVGKNTRTVTVTAPNGTTKTYTITITRSPEQNTGDNTTTTRPPVEDPLEVTVDGKNMTVADSQPAVELPAGYAWEPLDVNGSMVPAAVNKDNGLTLLYLTDTAANTSALYIYDKEGQFTPFAPLTATNQYVLLTIPEGMTPPVGAAIADTAIGDIPVKAFVYEDTALQDLLVVYAVGPTGHTGLYTYDKTDGSLQLYRELPTGTVPESDQDPDEEKPANGFVQWVTAYRTVILICAAAAGGLALLIAAIILLIVCTRRTDKCRH